MNITDVERLVRILLGTGAMLAAALLLTGAASVAVVLPEVVLIGAGIDLFVTGALGYSPLYQKLGHVHRSLKESS